MFKAADERSFTGLPRTKQKNALAALKCMVYSFFQESVDVFHSLHYRRKWITCQHNSVLRLDHHFSFYWACFTLWFGLFAEVLAQADNQGMVFIEQLDIFFQ